jgi:hypothetical protein
VHANEWNQPDLLKCNTLAKGNYFHCTRFGKLERGSLFGAPHGPDSDSRDGRRDLRKRQPDPNPPPQEESENEPIGDNPSNTGSGGGTADPSNPTGDTGPSLPGP